MAEKAKLESRFVFGFFSFMMIALILCAVPVKSQVVASSDQVEYLVITSEALSPGFQPLIEWKIRKGLSAEIITLEEIYARYEGPTDQLKIKRCLADYYERYQLKWALLGGDESVVPFQGCYAEVNTTSQQAKDWNIPTDLFYAGFDNRFDWNSEVDEKIGHIHRDAVDLIPEIFLTRVPLHSLQQVQIFVDKTLAYEVNPPLEDFAERMLLAGVKSWIIWDWKSDNHHRSELMYERSVRDNWDGIKMDFFDTGTDFPEQSLYNVTSDHFKDQLGQGYGLVHYAGPGTKGALRMEFGSPFSLVDAVEITGHKPGIFVSTNAEVNGYDNTTICLSEVLLSNPNGGCVAFFGNTRIGFGFSDTTMDLGPSYQYSANFFKRLFTLSNNPGGTTFGEVASLTKSDFVLNGSAGGAYHYLLYSINAMGDPELPIRTKKPAEFDRLRLYRVGNSITVNTGGIKDCRICITSWDLKEGFKEVVEGVSFHTFDSIPEQYQITVTSQNHVPYIYQSGIPASAGFDAVSQIRVFPNPFSESLNFEGDYLSGIVKVYDLNGKLIAQKIVTDKSASINLTEHSGGLYLVKMISGESSQWFKVVKQ